MKFYGDYHTHSRYSDGRQSLEDIVISAQSRGLKEVAVSDHGPDAAVIGIKNADSYLQIKEEVEAINDSERYDIEFLLGAEANIRDLQGGLDIPNDIIKQLDFLIVGLHPYTMPSSIDDGIKIWVQNSLRHLGKGQKEKAKNANTKASCEALHCNPQVEILAHPGLFFQVDIEEVARACIKNDVLFEINCGHEHPPISDIIVAERIGVDFIIDSDAHFPASVGQLSYGEHVIRSLDLNLDRVINLWDGGEYEDDSVDRQSACADNYRFIRGRKNADHKLS